MGQRESRPAYMESKIIFQVGGFFSKYIHILWMYVTHTLSLPYDAIHTTY